MNYPDPAYILNASNDLLEETTCFVFTNSPCLYYIIKEFSTAGIFHYEIKGMLGFNDLVELDHMWMPDYFEYVKFTRDTLDVRHILDFRFLQDLNCD